MSDAQSAPKSAAKTPSKPEDRLIIRPLSNIVFMYPSWIASWIFALVMSMGNASPEVPGYSGIVFTLFFFFNLSIVAFDYTRLTSIVIALILVILGLLSAMYPVVGEVIRDVFNQPLFMNATFYWVWAVGFTIILFAVLVKTRFDYWEIKNNELLHHHGLLGDVERWPAPDLRISKEINDVMEFLLLGAGRLVLVPQREPRALVIENVPNINRVEKRMQQLLGTLRVDGPG
ncbi:MAG: hypothetical protein R3F43_10510 [bacterium]